jgi:hypothetical protein
MSFLVDFSLQLGQAEPVPFSHFSMQTYPKKWPHRREEILVARSSVL